MFSTNFDGTERPTNLIYTIGYEFSNKIIYPPPRSNSTWSAIFATTATAPFDTLGVFRTANDVVPNTRQIAHSPAPDQNY